MPSRRSLLTALAAALIAACTQPMRGVPNTAPSIEGRVTAVSQSGEQIGTIRVEERPEETAGSAKASARITQSTDLWRGSTRADFRALAVGQWVRVWFTGPVAESYPVQATASTVVIDSTTR